MMWDTGSMGWSWGFGLLAIAGVGMIVSVVIRLLSSKSGNAAPPSRPNPGPSEPTRARLMLDERFARGELTTEQYRDQVRILGEDE